MRVLLLLKNDQRMSESSGKSGSQPFLIRFPLLPVVLGKGERTCRPALAVLSCLRSWKFYGRTARRQIHGLDPL